MTSSASSGTAVWADPAPAGATVRDGTLRSPAVTTVGDAAKEPDPSFGAASCMWEALEVSAEMDRSAPVES